MGEKCVRAIFRKRIPIFHAIRGSIHFSAPKGSSWDGCAEYGLAHDKRSEGESNYVCGWPADELRIRGGFTGGVSRREAGFVRCLGMRYTPTSFRRGRRFWGPRLGVHQFGIRLDVGERYVEIEVGPDCTRFPDSCVELEGGDDRSQFHRVRWEQPWTGGRWV